MKKIILILVLLITITDYSLAADSPSDVSEDALLDNEKEEKTIEDNIKESNVTEDKVKENEIKEENVIEDSIKEDPEEEKDTKEEKVTQEHIKEETLLDKVSEINLIQDDEQKVKEWAKFSSKENYVIINKKNCSATVYDKDGNEITSFEVGIGKEIGDDFNDTSGLLGKSKNTTPAGEYTLISNIFNKSAYGDITLSLGTKANKAKKSKKVVALHKVPKFRQKDRLNKFYDGNLANNRMSHGCINFIEEDFKELTKSIHGGFKVYVLPEESDNELILAKNDKNQFELTQTKH